VTVGVLVSVRVAVTVGVLVGVVVAVAKTLRGADASTGKPPVLAISSANTSPQVKRHDT